MAESILNGKKILAVDDKREFLGVLEDKIVGACPNCQADKATAHEKAIELLKSNTYDLVILDLMGAGALDLLQTAVSRNSRVALLTPHALNLKALKRSLKARSFLPKEDLGEVIPFLEGVLRYEYKPGWQRFFEKLAKYLIVARWRENWVEMEETIWKEPSW